MYKGMMYYTLSDFEKIGFNINTSDIVTTDTLDIINSLTDQVSSPSYSKSPSFNKEYNKKSKKHHDTVKPEDWEAIRNFQKTEIKPQEGTEKDISTVRQLINKITLKTYDIVFEKIIENLDRIISENSDNLDENMNIIGNAIFKMATSNTFNSKSFSKLCGDLCNKYDFMKNIINNNIIEFMKLFENMEFVDPNDDYDKFCKINIINDNRRAMSLFLCNLFEISIIDFTPIYNVLNKLLHMIFENKMDETKKLANDEIIENIFIIINNSPLNVLKEMDTWNYLHENICSLTTINVKETPGISSKCKFKNMDIKTLLEK